MNAADRKLNCEECGGHCYGRDALTAANPFDSDQLLTGCPNCKAPDSLIAACDEPFCWRDASCGTATATGYRQTCSEHRPREVLAVMGGK